jgi:predicted membrane channel-forming protein YqfA (hemolysin III family)
MIFAHPKATMLVGFIFVLLGVILPFLMVLKAIQATFLLSFISFGLSVSGLLLGIVGAASYVKFNRDKKKKEEE